MSAPVAATAVEGVVEERERSDPRPMRADARRNYERLVEAARGVFAESGTETSMEAIAKHAGVGIGTLYRHFPKRIDLVEAVYLEDVDTLTAAAERLVGELAPWGALVAWLDAFVRYSETKRILLSELHEAFEKNPQMKSICRGRIRGALATVLERAQEAGVVRRDLDSEDLMQLLGPMCMNSALTREQSQRLLKMIADGLKSGA